MRNRTIKKQFWLNESEDKLLKEKSKKAGLSEAEFIRCFIKEYKLTEVRKYKTNAITEIKELKSKRENLWKRHKQIKTDEEGQFICSEIQKLATKINELNENIKLCDFIENRTVRMRENIKDMRHEDKEKVKYKDRNIK